VAAALQVLGIMAVVAGISMVFVPAGFIAGGFGAVVVGVALERQARTATAKGDG